ncbi:unnamed protein product, partial [Amoebophrya sp. A25]
EDFVGGLGAEGDVCTATVHLSTRIQQTIDTLLRVPGTGVAASSSVNDSRLPLKWRAGGRDLTTSVTTEKVLVDHEDHKNVGSPTGDGWEQSYPSSYRFGDRNIKADKNAQAKASLLAKGNARKEKEFPHVILNEEDEKALFDVSVKLKYADLQAVGEACKDLRCKISDFPPQVFLQRPHIVEALGSVLSGNADCRAY